MIVLGIETAMPLRTVAVVDEKGVRASRVVEPAAEGGDAIIAALEKVLEEGGVPLSGLDAIGVSVGPGTYTGLRVGVAVAKGLAFATGKPVVPVSTLEALAASAVAEEGTIWALLDARKGEIYGAAFRLTGGRPERLTEDSVGMLEEVLSNRWPGAVCAGPAVALYGDRIRRFMGEGCFLDWRPCAESVGRLAIIQLVEGAAVPDPASLVPRYLRPVDVSPSGAPSPRTPGRGND